MNLAALLTLTVQGGLLATIAFVGWVALGEFKTH